MSRRADEGDWLTELIDFRNEGTTVIPLNDPRALAELESLAQQQSVPSGIRVFAREWLTSPKDPWQAVVRCVRAQRADVASQVFESPLVAPLRRLVSMAQRAAILIDQHDEHATTDPWSYLLQISPEEKGIEPGYIHVYLPLLPSLLPEAESLLGMSLPPSYVLLLNLTNGLGALGEIVGAGPQRADWNIVKTHDWLDYQGMSEIVAVWRVFQGTYAFERQRDAKTGITSFRSNERVLIPFMLTLFGDAWCFDRSKQQVTGEYPIVFWDHEQREGTVEFTSFADWLDARLSSEVFGEDE